MKQEQRRCGTTQREPKVGVETILEVEVGSRERGECWTREAEKTLEEAA